MARSVTNDQVHCLHLDKLGKTKDRRVLCACMACADPESFVMSVDRFQILLLTGHHRPAIETLRWLADDGPTPGGVL